MKTHWPTSQSVSGDDRHEPYAEEHAGFNGPRSWICLVARNWRRFLGGGRFLWPLLNQGTVAWTPSEAALAGSTREVLPGLTVWPLEPIPPVASRRIVVELDATESEAQGIFSLRQHSQSPCEAPRGTSAPGDERHLGHNPPFHQKGPLFYALCSHTVL